MPIGIGGERASLQAVQPFPRRTAGKWGPARPLRSGRPPSRACRGLYRRAQRERGLASRTAAISPTNGTTIPSAALAYFPLAAFTSEMSKCTTSAEPIAARAATATSSATSSQARSPTSTTPARPAAMITASIEARPFADQ